MWEIPHFLIFICYCQPFILCFWYLKMRRTYVLTIATSILGTVSKHKFKTIVIPQTTGFRLYGNYFPTHFFKHLFRSKLFSIFLQFSGSWRIREVKKNKCFGSWKKNQTISVSLRTTRVCMRSVAVLTPRCSRDYCI